MKQAVLAGAIAVIAACGQPQAPTDVADASGSGAVAILVEGGDPVAWRRIGPEGWIPPGDGGFVDGSWWALIRPPHHLARPEPPVESFSYGDVIAWSAADIDGDGDGEIVVSYRHPAREVAWDPRAQTTDALGRTAHLGVITADGTAVWLAHRVPHPIGDVAACGQATAVAYTSFTDDTVVAATAATWNGFGFTLAPELPGPARIGCGDVDGDGIMDPLVLRTGT